MATDLTVLMEDRPGQLAAVGEALGNAGVNIEGLCGLAYEGRGVAHLLVQDAAAARSALEAAGIQVAAEADPLVFDLSGDIDRPGAAGAMARKIADAGVNVLAVYLATGNRGVLVTSDNAAALAALGG